MFPHRSGMSRMDCPKKEPRISVLSALKDGDFPQREPDVPGRHVEYFERHSHRDHATNLTAGTSKEVGIHSRTVLRVCAAYAEGRAACRLPWLRWRGKKSLGWVPFCGDQIGFDGAKFKFRKAYYEPMHIRDLLKPGMKFLAGSFCADASGRWYLNVTIKVPCAAPRPERVIGVDLGLKSLASLSDGGKIEMPQFYRESELSLATAQRARKTKRARSIHAKARNRRKDFLHKASASLVREYGTIIVGDVSPSKLAKTRMAKSINDAGWAGFKNYLSYKSIRNGGRMIEVSEAMSTQTCSECGSLPPSRPKGIAGLGVRGWQCDDCGTVHDRDHNAAKNILRVGLDALVEGVPKGKQPPPSGAAHRLHAGG